MMHVNIHILLEATEVHNISKPYVAMLISLIAKWLMHEVV